MKAKVLATGDIIDVVKDWEDFGGVCFIGYRDNAGQTYDRDKLEILPDTPEIVIEGWVLRDDNNKIGIYREKPTCDEDGWDLTGEKYDLFPDITPDMLPKKYRITITPME